MPQLGGLRQATWVALVPGGMHILNMNGEQVKTDGCKTCHGDASIFVPKETSDII